MAFKTQLSAAGAFDRLQRQAAATKTYLQNQRVFMVAATCNADTPLSVIQHLGQVSILMATWATTPGLAQYARDQYNDPTYDVVAEFNAMKSAIDTARDTLITAFPKDAGGFILYQKINPDGSILLRTFTSAQLAGSVAQVDSVIAAIA
jgi:hypothetical protein